MSAWEAMPWSSAMLFILSAFVILCLLFLWWDSWRHRERRRPPMAVDMPIDEIMLRRLKRSVERRISCIKQANGK